MIFKPKLEVTWIFHRWTPKLRKFTKKKGKSLFHQQEKANHDSKNACVENYEN